MPTNTGLKIWGRANSVNVQKVLWCLAELDLAYERIDAGMEHGKTQEAEYLAMNPNARVPTMVDGDYVLWESNSIMRYLCMAYRKGTPIYPADPKRRAAVDRWLDWTLSTVQPVDRPVFWGIVRTPPEKRDLVQVQKDADAEAIVWRIADQHLSTRRYIEGEDFTIADIALGAYARRWLGVEASRARSNRISSAGSSRTWAAGPALRRLWRSRCHSAIACCAHAHFFFPKTGDLDLAACQLK